MFDISPSSSSTVIVIRLESYARNIKEQDPSISIASFQDGQWKPVVVLGGFATVDSNQLSVLVNDFEKAG